MVTSQTDRRRRRRQVTIDEALDHAVAIMQDAGVGGLTISEVARCMGIRGPSLYKYFPSLHALYDALFARGVAAHGRALEDAMTDVAPGVERLRALGRASVRWAVANPALAQLVYWRPVPGFEPSPAAFAGSVEQRNLVQAEFVSAVRARQLTSTLDPDEAVRLFTVVLSGLATQQMANQPGATYEQGLFSSLTDTAIEMFLAQYRPPRRR